MNIFIEGSEFSELSNAKTNLNDLKSQSTRIYFNPYHNKIHIDFKHAYGLKPGDIVQPMVCLKTNRLAFVKVDGDHKGIAYRAHKHSNKDGYEHYISFTPRAANNLFEFLGIKYGKNATDQSGWAHQGYMVSDDSDKHIAFICELNRKI